MGFQKRKFEGKYSEWYNTISANSGASPKIDSYSSIGNLVSSMDWQGEGKESICGVVDSIDTSCEDIYNGIQANIFKKALEFRNAHIYECDDYNEFKEKIKDGGFFLCHWDGTEETEARIKEETGATIRCVPYEFEQTTGLDMVSGKPAKCRVIMARAY